MKRLWDWLTSPFRRKIQPVAPPPEPSPYKTQVIRRGRLGALSMQTSPAELVSRIPKVGDRVWWAPKQLWCEITRVDMDAMNFVFIGGEPVRTADGKIRPRWAVNTGMSGHHFSESINSWVVGRGLLPKNVRGKIITPETIKLQLNVSTGETARKR